MSRLINIFLTTLTVSAVGFTQSRVPLTSPTDPRGEVELVLCSLNLENYGTFLQVKKRSPGMTKEALVEKTDGLAQRMVTGQCDVIGVQEVLGETDEDALTGLKILAEALRRKSGRVFEYTVGDNGDGPIRVGFLYAVDRVEQSAKLSYKNVQLPALAPQQKPRVFPRPPLEVQFLVKPRGESLARTVTVVNVHLKSKSGGKNDPTQLQWETARMEAAEAVRRVLVDRFRNSFTSAEMPLLLIGDRNSDFDSGTARILEGSVTLKEFQDSAPCRLSKKGVALCQEGIRRPQQLFSVLTSDPHVRGRGSFEFNGDRLWLDDIMTPHVSLPLAWDSFDREGDYNVGVVSIPEDASDHALVWVALNW